ncbi:PAS domain S-box protein, partial [Methanosarcina sp. 2.H.T.1A.15]|uniref:PAS domain S-box protein n=1 Tax=Methanosarcina sp. 2.H.T.1A.15 TaxID=1483596 RepID=UPI00062104A0
TAYEIASCLVGSEMCIRDRYIAVLENVPRLSREAVDTGMTFFMKLAHMFSQLSYSNIKLAQSLSERDSLVDALRESEERFRSVLENSLDVAYRRNLQTGCYDYMSPVVEQITGFSAQKMSAMSINEVLDHVHPDDRPQVTAELVQAFETGHGTLEYRFKRKDGKYRWLADHFTVIKDQNDIPLFSGGIIRDITRQKQAEEALIRSENKFRTLAENSPDVISRLDRQNRHMYVNPAAAEPYGHSPEEIVGKTNSELGMDPENVKFWEGHYENVFTTGKPETMEFHYKSPQGKEYYFNTRIVPEFIGGEVSSVLAISRDITDEKEVEAKLKEAYENLEKLVEERTTQLENAYNSLKESEKGLAEAQKMAHIGNWYWDIATDKTYWSEEMYSIFGRDPRELAPSYNEYLSYIHPDDRDYFDNATMKAVNGKPYSIDHRIILANGEERTVHIQSEVMYNEENIPIQIKGIVQDITERKKAEKALVNLEIARKKEIHHRIKNNLQVISSLLDLQAEKFNNRKCVKDSEIMEAFRESQNRVLSMALIHEELHEGREIDKLKFSPYLEKLAENLFKTYSLGNADISLSLDLEENVFFDMDIAVPLGIIINELISNSLKHAFVDRDRGEIRIKLYREKTGECIKNRAGSKKEECKPTSFVLAVSDDGIGVPESFDLKNPDRLGIQLVIALVDQLEGELELKRNSGTEFIIRFKVEEKQ